MNVADDTRYRTGAFARRAGVTVRTLRYYDQRGLLRPSARSWAGHRLYSDADMVRLEQILALKFVGFALEEIARYLAAGADDLLTGLARQKALFVERRDQMRLAIRAIERVEALAHSNEFRLDELARIMEAFQMEPKEDMLDRHFTPEQARAMRDITDGAYTDEARAKLAGRPAWTDEDQRRVDVEYASIAEGLRHAAAMDLAPDSPVAQDLARRTMDLLQQFTQGDADVAAGLDRWWKGWQAMPEADRPAALPWGPAEGELLARAQEIYRKRLAGKD